jgi:hypothetical protein
MGLDKSDLKRYYPEIYEQYYGEGTEEAANRKLEREKNILEQRIKDDYYNYVPKQNIKPSSERRSTNRSAERRSINRRSTRD